MIFPQSNVVSLEVWFMIDTGKPADCFNTTNWLFAS